MQTKSLTKSSLLEIDSKTNSFPDKIPENKGFLEFIFNTSIFPISLIDREYKYVTANNAFCTLVQCPLEKIKGMHIYDLWGVTNFNEIIKSKLDRAFNAERVHYEAWLKNKSEENRCFNIDYNPLANSIGDITHVAVTSEDITKKKQIENVREKIFKISDSAQSTKNLNQLYTSIHKITSELMPAENFYIAIHDKQSDLLSFPYFVDESEASPAPESLGKGLTEYVLLKKKAMLVTQDVLINLIQDGEVEDIGTPSIDWLGVPLVIKDRAFGVLVVQSYSESVRYTEDDKKNLEFISSQIAMAIERKTYEGKLKESNRRFKNLYENSTIGLYTSTPEGKLLMANNVLVKMFGYDSLKELQKIDLTKQGYADPNSRKIFKEKIEERGHVYGFESEWVKSNGKKIFLRESARVLSDEEGNPKTYEGTVEDITEKKKIEQEIIKAKEKSEKLEQMKSYFLSQMSHEIRTPLNTLQNFNYLIREKLSDQIDEELETFFGVIFAESKRITRTIDLILNMTDLHSGSYKLEKRTFDVYTHTLLNILNDFKYSYDVTKLKIEINLNTENTVMSADEYCVEQILRQLIDNAIKYTIEGTVSINLFRDKSDKLNIEVKDTGIGISKEYLDNLFTLFSQEDEGYSRKYDGNGLGLALVKEYCKLNSFQIEAHSEKDNGSTFTVIFV